MEFRGFLAVKLSKRREWCDSSYWFLFSTSKIQTVAKNHFHGFAVQGDCHWLRMDERHGIIDLVEAQVCFGNRGWIWWSKEHLKILDKCDFMALICLHQVPQNASEKTGLTTAQDRRTTFLTGKVWLKSIAPVWLPQPLVASFGRTRLQRGGAGWRKLTMGGKLCLG